MRIVTAIDSFKGSLSSRQAGEAAREGILRVFPTASVQVFPIADGGEGTAAVLTEAVGGTTRTVTVTGPLGAPVEARYGVSADGVTAYMDMASAAGITLIGECERDPLCATTYGVGEMIADALSNGCRRIVMGIGGSATNDGGAGMLEALGFGLLDENGAPIARGAKGLSRLARITTDGALAALSNCDILVACDVTNPLCGENGCSTVYGPQKGATPSMVRDMDAWLENYAALVKTVIPSADDTAAGAGAAGGIGFALCSFLKARLQSGIALIAAETGLAAALEMADIVLTGEGRLDEQTAMGKAPVGVARLAKTYGKPVFAFAGGVTNGARACHDEGIDAYFPIVRGVCTLEQALNEETAYANMANTAEEVFRVIRAMGRETA